MEYYCETSKMQDTNILNPTSATLLLGREINKVLGGINYKLRRVGTNAIIPIAIDNSIIRGISRYDCLYDLQTDTIYKK